MTPNGTNNNDCFQTDSLSTPLFFYWSANQIDPPQNKTTGETVFCRAVQDAQTNNILRKTKTLTISVY